MKAKFLYTGIRVKDLEASVRFYTRVLGLRVRGRNPSTAAKGELVDLVDEKGAHTLELNHYSPESDYATPYEAGEGLDHLAFVVDDLDVALSEAASAGYPALKVFREPGSRYAYICDPNGIWIELAQFG